MASPGPSYELPDFHYFGENMNRTILRVALGAIGVAASLWLACGETPPPTSPSLVLSKSPATSVNRGEEVTLTATAREADGGPGSGDVRFVTDFGSLNGKGKDLTAPLVNGVATARHVCAAADGCPSRVDVNATWNGIPSAVTIIFNPLPPPDAGETDAGVDAGELDGGDGGEGDAGFLELYPTSCDIILASRLQYAVLVLGGLDDAGTQLALVNADYAVPPCVGFSAVPERIQITPTGKFQYLAGNTVKQVVADPLFRDAPDASWQFPLAPEANDTVVTTPNCNTVDDYALATDGVAAYMCSSNIYAGGVTWTNLPAQKIWAHNSSRSVLVQTSNGAFVGKPSPNQAVQVTGLPDNADIRTARGTANGFNVVLFETPTDGGAPGWSLWTVDAPLGTTSSSASFVSVYPTAPANSAISAVALNTQDWLYLRLNPADLEDAGVDAGVSVVATFTTAGTADYKQYLDPVQPSNFEQPTLRVHMTGDTTLTTAP